jgi:hypothetical protein
LVHEGCTTAIEAWLSDVSIIRYNVIRDPRYDRVLPNRFGVDCTTEDEAVAALGKIVGAGAAPAPEAAVDALAQSLLENLRGEAFARVAGVLEEALATRSVRPSSLRKRYVLQTGAAAAIEQAKARVRPLFPARLRMQQYSRGKFYGFDTAGVPDRLARVRQITGIAIRHTLHGNALLRLEA